MSNIYPLLPRLTVNSRFIDEFLAAEAPCCALGLVEVRKQTYGFLALRPEMVIPEIYTCTGFSFGHSLFGTQTSPWFTLASISIITQPST
jgi:hypothetical protein